MAVGDQWIMFGTGSASIRPSSGVEVVIKSACTYPLGSSNFGYGYHVSSSTSGSAYGIVAGTYYGYGSTYQLKPSMKSEYHASSTAAEAENVAIPINNTYYIDVSYTGSYAPAYNMGGFITKD